SDLRSGRERRDAGSESPARGGNGPRVPCRARPYAPHPAARERGLGAAAADAHRRSAAGAGEQIHHAARAPQCAARDRAAPAAVAVVREVLDAVRRDGDAALRALTRRFDGVELESLAVSEAEFAAARGALTDQEISALARAVGNVRAFHLAQRPTAVAVETEPGVRCAQLIRPIDAVGLCVPAGSAPLPSTVVMLVLPCRLAGCPRRVLCTPPSTAG